MSDERRPWFAPPCWGRFLKRSVLSLAGRFHRIVSRASTDATAIGAFEDSQVGADATCSDADQHHATLARRAKGPGYRNQRRFWSGIDLGHLKLLPIWRGMPYAKPPPRAADSPATDRPCRAPMPATVQYCSYFRKSAVSDPHADGGNSESDRWSVDCAILLSKASEPGSI